MWKDTIKKKDIQFQQALDKIAETIRESLSDIDNEVLMAVIMPHGRTEGTYKNKEELVEHLTQEAIKRIQSNKLYKGDIISKKRSEEQQTDAMDFAVSVTDRIVTLLNRSRPQRDLTLGQRGEVRRYLKKLFLEAKLDD